MNIDTEIDTAAYRTRVRLESMLDVVEAWEGRSAGEVRPLTVPQPLCLSVDLDWICDSQGQPITKSTRNHLYADQITICESCRLQTECLETAMQRPEPYGIWGGKMPAERAALRKRRKTTRR